MTVKLKKKMIKEWESLDNDTDRWRWFIKNQNKGVMVLLDNDSTFGVFKEDHEDWTCTEPYTFYFDGCIGQASILLDCIGIENDGV